MGSPLFQEYDRNLRRIYLAEFIDDQIQGQEAWRRRASPAGALFSDAVRAEVRAKLTFGSKTEVS